MESSEQEQIQAIFNYAAHLLVNEDKLPSEVISLLQEKGLDAESATIVADRVQAQIVEARKSRARKDMLYGALWCVGGTVATLADIGFIFWGAILFGGIQFFKGVVNSAKD